MTDYRGPLDSEGIAAYIIDDAQVCFFSIEIIDPNHFGRSKAVSESNSLGEGDESSVE